MKFLSSLKIGKRLYLVFGIIIFLSLVNLVYNLINLNSSRDSVTAINNSLQGIDFLVEADRDAYQSHLAINECLREDIYSKESKLKSKIQSIDENRKQVKERFDNFSNIFNLKENENQEKLEREFNDNYKKLSLLTDSIIFYLNGHNIDKAREIYLGSYVVYFGPMRAALDDFTNIYTQESENTYQTNIGLIEGIKRNAIVMFVIILGIFTLAGLVLSKSISGPLGRIKEVLEKLSAGKITDIKVEGNDEVSEMALHINKLAEGLNRTASFASEIGNGNLSAEFIPLSEDDTLGHSLKNMQKNLSRVAEEDKQRNWANSGVAQIGETLRNHKLSEKELYNVIVADLVKYMHANQGGLFIVNENNEQIELELAACYAYNRIKYMEKTLKPGEGLVGQAYLEKDIINLTEVPDNYLKITSGIGEANPRNILIVPLKANDEIHGVLELASFQLFQPFEIDFVKRIAESIASSISLIKINERTKKLLEHSQHMAEALQSQEEEMRKNLEDLMLASEEASRKEQMLTEEIQRLQAEKTGVKV